MPIEATTWTYDSAGIGHIHQFFRLGSAGPGYYTCFHCNQVYWIEKTFRLTVLSEEESGWIL